MNYIFNIADLIIRKIENKLTDEEGEKLQAWLDESNDNRILFKKCIDQKRQLNKLEIYRLFDREKAWSSIEDEIFPVKNIAFGSKRFTGRVVHIEQVLGCKNVHTYRPTEKIDTKILEVVIALDDGSELPLDLQMTTWFLFDEDPGPLASDNE